MKKVRTLLNILTVLMLGLTLVGGVWSQQSESAKVVPDSERKIANDLSAQGPTETKGIESALVLGSLSLAGEFAGTDGYMLRAREVTVLPGGQVAVHQHTNRPGVAYVLEGELVEHRSDTDGPVARKIGAVAFEKTGTIHWWKNESSASARVLVVDIVPVDTK